MPSAISEPEYVLFEYLAYEPEFEHIRGSLEEIKAYVEKHPTYNYGWEFGLYIEAQNVLDEIVKNIKGKS